MNKLQDNEQLFISTLLKSDSKRAAIIKQIDNPDHYFTVGECRSLFVTIKRLQSSKKKIDLETVNAFCKKVEFKDIKHIYDKYSEIDEQNISAHLDLLRANSLEFDLSNSYFKKLTNIIADPKQNVSYKAQAISEITAEIDRRQTQKSETLKDMGKLMEEQKELFEERKKGYTFHTTGDFRIDACMSYGYTPKEMTVMAGRPSNGKSLFRLDNARKLGNQQIPVAVFNMEMRNHSDLDRLLCMSTQIESTKLVKNFGDLSRDEMSKLLAEMERLSNNFSVYMDDEPIQTLETIKSSIGNLQEKLQKEYIVVYLDLFTKLVEFDQAAGPFDFEKICNKMQKLTRQMGIHSVLILQINRSADKERLNNLTDVPKVYPRFSQIKNSSAFEEVADNIFLLCRPSNYLRHYEFGGHVPEYLRLEIAKQRHGLQSSFENVILYKNNNNYLGLITPDDNWDPLAIEIDDKDLDGYMNK